MKDLSKAEMKEISQMYGNGKYNLTLFLYQNGHKINQGEDPRKTLMTAFVHFGIPNRNIGKRLSKRIIAAISLYPEINKEYLLHAVKVNTTSKNEKIIIEKGADYNLPIKAGASFYSTPEWKRARYQAIVKYGNSCQCCGASPKDGIVIHVDHIKPKSLYPELALDIDNLQILCAECNEAKSNVDETDWR